MRFSEIERAAACYNGAESGAERERGAFSGRRSRIARGAAENAAEIQEGQTYAIQRLSVRGVAAYLFGPWDVLLTALLAAVILDYATGVAAAAMQKQLSSAIGFRGLVRKVTLFLIVGLAAMLDRLVLGTNGALRAAVCLFYLVNEGLSVLENAAKIGLPLPDALKNALAQLSEKK